MNELDDRYLKDQRRHFTWFDLLMGLIAAGVIGYIILSFVLGMTATQIGNLIFMSLK